MFEYATKNKLDRVMIGNTEFVLTPDSFKLNELNLEELKKPCTVC